jgi:hypothetical protein
MNKRSRSTSIFLQAISYVFLILSIFAGIGIKFFDLFFNFNEEIRTTAFWIAFAISTILTFIMFFSSSSISTNKEFKSNDDYKKKLENNKEVNVITGLEYAEDFLDEHFLDKKYDKVLRKLKNKMERIKKRVDRRGYNFKDPEKHIFKPIRWYRWFNGKLRFDRLYRKYTKVKDKIESPDLREDLKYTYVRGIYRVTKVYLSDGINKYSINGDPDKPASAIGLHAKKGSQRLIISFITVLFMGQIAYELIDQGFTQEFWIDLIMKLISYLVTIVNGFIYGKLFFDEVYLGTEMKRENLLEKYIKWLIVNHPATWEDAKRYKHQLYQDRLDAEARIKLENEKISKQAKSIEESMNF